MFDDRPYQREAIEAVHKAHAMGLQRPLVALPTGTGKTIIFARLLTEREGRALVLAHRDELIQQAVEKLQRVNPAFDIGVVKAERDETDAPVRRGLGPNPVPSETPLAPAAGFPHSHCR